MGRVFPSGFIAFIAIMSLDPPSQSDYVSLSELEDAIQAHAKIQGYAITKKRSKVDPKTNVIKKA